MMEKKLYVGDPDIPYITTKIPPLRTKVDIDGILARWGITKVAWEFDLEGNSVKLQFELPPEKFQGKTINPLIRLEPPRIWDKQTKRSVESINWRVSLRILHWYIKDTLAMAYAMQSQKAVAFLPHIAIGKEETVKDVLIPSLSTLKALPEERRGGRILEGEVVEP